MIPVAWIALYIVATAIGELSSPLLNSGFPLNLARGKPCHPGKEGVLRRDTLPFPVGREPIRGGKRADFWWANSHNPFTRNAAVESDQHGFRFDAVRSADFDTTPAVQQPDGSRRNVDIGTLPFVRFEDNKAHSPEDCGQEPGCARDRVRDGAV